MEVAPLGSDWSFILGGVDGAFYTPQLTGPAWRSLPHGSAFADRSAEGALERWPSKA